MNSSQPFYCFDLDGTLLRAEVLPALAAEVGLAEEMSLLTGLTMQGLVSFEMSFRLRCRLLREVPLERARSIVAQIPVEPVIAAFIEANPGSCAVVTSNLDVWVRHLILELGCEAFTSEAFVVDDALADVACILDKGQVIEQLRARGHGTIVAIGDGANDVPMLAGADVGIAFAGNHPMSSGLLAVADVIANDGADLERLLGSEGLISDHHLV